MLARSVQIGPISIGADEPLTVIAGPCAIESLDECLRIGEAIRDRCATLGLGCIFKASYDKANRSSITSRRGPGLDEGLRILDQVRQKLALPVTTDIHEPAHADAAAQAVNLLQIPAFLCRQTDLLLAAAKTGKPVNVKKGQFVSPGEMRHVVDKLTEGGAAAGGSGGIVLTERGTFFGYHRLVNDFVGLGDLMDLGWPVCFDVTHSTQLPGQTTMTGGRPERAPLLARCAVAAGVAAVFIETHFQPDEAASDAATMLPLDVTLNLLDSLARLHQATHEP